MSSTERPLAAKLARSRPEQKLLPSPCSTTARTEGSAATSSMAAPIAANIAKSSALCLSGRSRRTSATWSRIVTSTRCSASLIAAQTRTAWRSMIAAVSTPCRQRAEDVAPVAVEPGRAEGVGDRRVAVADEQRPLQGECHPLDEAAGARSPSRSVSASSAARAAPSRSSRGSASGAAPTSSANASRAAGLLTIARSTSRRLDVAGALPDRLQRRLAEQPRHPRLLDVAVAAEALERLDRVLGGALAGPVLEDRRRDPADQSRALVAGVGLVELAGEPEARDRRRLGLDREVGEHVAPSAADRRARFPKADRCCGVPDRLRGAGPHPGAPTRACSRAACG